MTRELPTPDRDADDDEALTGRIATPPDQDPDSAEIDLDDDEDEDEPEVSPDLVFTTSVKDRKDSQTGESLPFRIDGQTYYAERPPESAFIFVTQAAARSTPTADKMRCIIEFIGEALTEESGIRIKDRLLDAADDFEFDDLLPILQKLVRHWSKTTKSNRPGQARSRRSGRR